MKIRNLFSALALGGLLSIQSAAICRAQNTNETALIKILQDDKANRKEKNAACIQLKRIGTKASIKALASLLTDTNLSQSARYVLETIPGSQAEKALTDALSRTTGELQAGVANSLGARGDTAAVPQLGKLLASSDSEVAVAAAKALSHIRGPKALGVLQADATKSTDALHLAEVDAILACANQMLDAGKKEEALKVFESIHASEKPDYIRMAAFHGVLLASGDSGLQRLTDAIKGSDLADQSEALLLAPTWPGTGTTKALADLLPSAPLAIQTGLIQCLQQRNDPAGMSALVKAMDSPDAGVRTAAMAALGFLGDQSVVDLLAGKASSTSGKERAAARQALLDLHRGDVTQQMLGSLKTADPKVGAELLTALGGRGDKSVVPALQELALSGKDAERAPAFQALASLVDAAQASQMVEVVQHATTDDLRGQAADALNSAFERLQSFGIPVDGTALGKAASSGSVETRLALLPVCSSVSAEPVRAALQAAIADPDTRIHDAGIHALCDTRDPELLPELLKRACDTNQSSTRLLAVRGCVRLATAEDTLNLSTDKKIETLKAILATPLDTQEKRAVLGGLGTILDKKSLELVEPMLNDEAVRPEAEQAVVTISTSIEKKNPVVVKKALNKVVAMTKNEDLKKTAEDELKKIK